jgi:hypothetical protein
MESLETFGENLWVKLTIKRTVLLVCVVYFPPNSEEEVFSSFYRNLEMAGNTVRDKIIIIFGDFNLPSCKYPKDEHCFFLKLFDLCQVNCIKNSSDKMLDLVFTNLSPESLVVSRHGLPLVAEDHHHPTLNISMSLSTCKYQKEPLYKSPIQSRWKFTKNNVPLLKDMMNNASWQGVLQSVNVDDALQCFYNELYEIFDNSFANCVEDIRMGYPEWFTVDLIRCINKKHFFHKLWKQTTLQRAYERFSDLRKSIKENIRQCYERYINRSEEQICDDPKMFWNFIASKRNVSQFPKDMTYNNVTYSEPQQIAQVFSEYFSSV